MGIDSPMPNTERPLDSDLNMSDVPEIEEERISGNDIEEFFTPRENVQENKDPQVGSDSIISLETIPEIDPDIDPEVEDFLAAADKDTPPKPKNETIFGNPLSQDNSEK